MATLNDVMGTQGCGRLLDALLCLLSLWAFATNYMPVNASHGVNDSLFFSFPEEEEEDANSRRQLNQTSVAELWEDCFDPVLWDGMCQKDGISSLRPFAFNLCKEMDDKEKLESTTDTKCCSLRCTWPPRNWGLKNTVGPANVIAVVLYFILAWKSAKKKISEKIPCLKCCIMGFSNVLRWGIGLFFCLLWFAIFVLNADALNDGDTFCRNDFQINGEKVIKFDANWDVACMGSVFVAWGLLVDLGMFILWALNLQAMNTRGIMGGLDSEDSSTNVVKSKKKKKKGGSSTDTSTSKSLNSMASQQEAEDTERGDEEEQVAVEPEKKARRASNPFYQ